MRKIRLQRKSNWTLCYLCLKIHCKRSKR